jgi:hypothetical protein
MNLQEGEIFVHILCEKEEGFSGTRPSSSTGETRDGFVE